MSPTQNKTHSLATQRRGASLVEVVVASLMLVSITVVGLRAFPDMRDSQLETTELIRGYELARELMTEIMQQHYEEQFESVVFGPEPAEVTNPKTRTKFDDVDDYKDWNKDEDLPLQDKEGTPLNIGSGWVRTVKLEYVRQNLMHKATGNDEGVKRAIVKVSRHGKELATLVATVSKHWQAPPYD